MTLPQILTISMRDKPPPGYRIINVTSRGTDAFKHLSPFEVTNPYCYQGLSAKTVENAHQYSKVYEFYDDNGVPKPEWFIWRDKGFSAARAHRYPYVNNIQVKGMKPLYSWWNNVKFGYVEARKRIYFPVYEASIYKSLPFSMLSKLYHQGDELAIQDFDCYRFDLEGLTLKEVVNNPDRKCGHGFVVLKMLTGQDI